MKLKAMIAAGIVWVVMCATMAGAADLQVAPDVRIREGEVRAGVKASWTWGRTRRSDERGVMNDERGARTAATSRSARTRYVEEAVPLWTPGYGEMIAMACGATEADINFCVDAREEPIQLTMMQELGAHVARNKWRYTTGTVLAGILAAVGANNEWFAFEESESASTPAASSPSEVSAGGTQSSAVSIAGVYVAPGATFSVTVNQPLYGE